MMAVEKIAEGTENVKNHWTQMEKSHERKTS